MMGRDPLPGGKCTASSKAQNLAHPPLGMGVIEDAIRLKPAA